MPKAPRLLEEGAAFICCHPGDIPPEPPIKLAQLEPDETTHLYCFVCDERFKVSREKCAARGVDVIQEGDWQCLSCNGDPHDTT